MAESDLANAIIAGVVAFVVIGVMLTAFGIPVAADQFALLIGLFGLLLFLRLFARDLSIGFMVMSTIIAFLLIEFIIPDLVVDNLANVVDFVLGLFGASARPLADIDPIQFAIVGTLFVFLMVMAQLRLTGQKKFIRPLVDRTIATFAKWFQIYFTVGRLLALSVVIVIVALMGQAALFAGEFGTLVQQAPFVFTNIVIGIIGYFSLGGSFLGVSSIPVIGDLTATEFAWVVVFWMAVAAGIAYQASGPLAQFLRR